jgi:iron complex outermembrane receptor protein
MLKEIRVLTALWLAAAFCANGYCEATPENDPYQLTDMTVTAQKKEEKMQDVPISIDVFSEVEIEDANIENTSDLTRYLPNVHMESSHCEHVVVIRGVSSFPSALYSPAGYYVDDVSYPLQQMQDVELFDIERAEVLKGPQGTLYGRNSESGVINIITKQPDSEYCGKIFGEYGNYNTFRSGANVSGPVIDNKLYLGAAFQYKSSDGYIENESNGDDEAADMEHVNGRATLRWTPDDYWDISLISDIMNADDHGGGYRYVDGPQATDYLEVRKDFDEYDKENGNSQILRAKYNGDTFDVLSVSSLLYYRLDKCNDSDIWDNPANQKINYFKLEERQYSQEFRISSAQEGPFEWLLGAYGFIEETTLDYRYDIVSAGMTYMHPVTDVDTTGYAAFGQATCTLFDKLHLTAGLRFDHQELEGHLEDAVREETCDKDLNYDEVLPKFSMACDISRDIMLYASASKGYLVGGYNWCMTPTQENFHYDPEYTWNYETGIKTNWLNNKLMANLSVFYIDIEDKQITEMGYTLTKSITNAAKAHSQGVELQLKARPLQGLDVFAGFGYAEATFDDFSSMEWNEDNTALIEKDYEDNDLPYAPHYTYNAGIQYRTSNGFFGRADLFGTDRFYGDSANASKQDAYQTVNLRIGYEGRHFDCYLWAENIFDEDYLTYVAPYGGNTIGLDGAPMTFGLTLTYRF